MPNKLANTTLKQDLQTELHKTEKQILNHINQIQPVCQKVIKLQAQSKSASAIDKSINSLLDKNLIEVTRENLHSRTLETTEKGRRQLQ